MHAKTGQRIRAQLDRINATQARIPGANGNAMHELDARNNHDAQDHTLIKFLIVYVLKESINRCAFALRVYQLRSAGPGAALRCGTRLS